MEEKIKKVVREYIERVFKLFETRWGVTTDEAIDCPQCGRHRGISLTQGGWRCHWIDCNFTFPKGLTPPTPRELEVFLYQKELEKRISKFLTEDELATYLAH